MNDMQGLWAEAETASFTTEPENYANGLCFVVFGYVLKPNIFAHTIPCNFEIALFILSITSISTAIFLQFRLFVIHHRPYEYGLTDHVIPVGIINLTTWWYNDNTNNNTNTITNIIINTNINNMYISCDILGMRFLKGTAHICWSCLCV